jgi:hypothetical protein
MIRVAVTGGRDYADKAHVHRVLDDLHAEQKIACVIQGGARGADWHAREWARERGIPTLRYQALWIAQGKAAGPIRNRRMLTEGMPDLLVAFPGNVGTDDCFDQAVRIGVPRLDLRGYVA